MADKPPMRPCSECGNYDDHPRHIVGQPDGTDQLRHLDCCAEAGCPDGSCDKAVEGAQGAQGDSLRTYLTKDGK